MSPHSNRELDCHVDSTSPEFNHPPDTPIFDPLNLRTRVFRHPQACWRPRRRTVLTIALIALVASSLFFLKGLASSNSKNVQRWDYAHPKSIITSTKGPTATAKTATVTETTTVYHHSVAPKLDPVVFFLIIWSETSAVEGAILIKVSERGVIYLRFVFGLILQ